MHFQVQHSTAYEYSRPVFLEPHTLRFMPRLDGSQRATQFQLQIAPTPQGTTEFQDAAGNTVTRVWFDGLHQRLEVRAQLAVATLRSNPFDFLIQPNNRTIPVQYSPEDWLTVNSALDRGNNLDDPVREMAQDYLQLAGGETIPFLVGLTQGIHSKFEVIHRETGGPWAPKDTLAARKGACRDLACLMIDACRSLGLAARFVSGYQEGRQAHGGDPSGADDRRDLHAWAEVYIPNAGWRGFDPTHGLAVADRHVTIAASAHPAMAAPITGSVRGTDFDSRMEIELQVSVEQ